MLLIQLKSENSVQRSKYLLTLMTFDVTGRKLLLLLNKCLHFHLKKETIIKIYKLVEVKFLF